jgi:hypothetical protein
MDRENAVCQILIRNSSPIEQFIHPQAGDVLYANMCRIGQNRYVVFFNKNRDTAVAYDLRSFENSRLDVVNYGFGTIEPNGDWYLFHTNAAGHFFESQGGVGTLQEIDDAMRHCAKQKMPMQFNWPATNNVDI